MSRSAPHRKWPTIDLIKLKSKAGTKQWNEFLTSCLSNLDIEKLTQTRYGLMAGMSDLAKKGLNDSAICSLYVRLVKSVENTAKRIIRIKYPSHLDNPMVATQYVGDALVATMLAHKRNRDFELEKFFRESQF